MKQVFPGYDITGKMNVKIIADFAFKNLPNTITVQFVPTTIMNQADFMNLLVLNAPVGYVFPEECSSNFDLK